MGLCTDTESTKLGSCRINTLLLEHLCQTNGIRRDSVQTSGSKILDELDLTLGVTCCSGNSHSPQPFGTILETKTTSKHAIAARVLKHITLTTTNHI